MEGEILNLLMNNKVVSSAIAIVLYLSWSNKKEISTINLDIREIFTTLKIMKEDLDSHIKDSKDSRKNIYDKINMKQDKKK